MCVRNSCINIFFLIPAGFEPIISDHLLAFGSIEPLLDNGAEQERNKEKNVFIFILNESNLQNKIVPLKMW